MTRALAFFLSASWTPEPAPTTVAEKIDSWGTPRTLCNSYQCPADGAAEGLGT